MSTDNQLKQHSISVDIPACRTGWAGAWDAIKAAATGQKRLTVLETYRFSVWSNAAVELSAEIVDSEPKEAK